MQTEMGNEFWSDHALHFGLVSLCVPQVVSEAD